MLGLVTARCQEPAATPSAHGTLRTSLRGDENRRRWEDVGFVAQQCIPTSVPASRRLGASCQPLTLKMRQILNTLTPVEVKGSVEAVLLDDAGLL